MLCRWPVQMSFLTLDMMEQERKKVAESERIQRRTTVNFDKVPLALCFMFLIGSIGLLPKSCKGRAGAHISIRGLCPVQPLEGVASERAAVLARAHYTQTLRPESSERITRAKKTKDDVDSVSHRPIVRRA